MAIRQKRFKYGSLICIIALAIAGLVWHFHNASFPILQPKGIIASKEQSLMLITLCLGLIVVIPVLVLTIFIAWKYREGNLETGDDYTPDWDHSRILETIWWGIPCIIIGVLAVITWVSSHNLDPYKPIDAKKPAILIKVVALPWKWLFIYPDQNVATVNYLQIPKDTPINFEITGDAAMNSFWIPQLGGQIYAMAGMTTKLHLLATENGVYQGSSANLSGRGFAGMRFTTKVTSESDYTNWLSTFSPASKPLSVTEYNKIAQPSENNPVSFYTPVDPYLYDGIIMKYMMPMSDPSSNPGGAQ